MSAFSEFAIEKIKNLNPFRKGKKLYSIIHCKCPRCQKGNLFVNPNPYNLKMLDVMPKTGRKNQIRVQLSDMGHPIAGDGKYGGLFSVAGVEIQSLTLHAAALDIPHPAGGRKTFTAPPPPAFLEAQRSLGLETAKPAEA